MSDDAAVGKGNAMTVRLAITVCGIAAAISVLGAAVSPSAGADNASTRYAIVFHQHASLPQDVDRIVEDAGGVVTMRLPQIGAVAATSSDPGFAGAVAANSEVALVGEDGSVAVDEPPAEANAETDLADGTVAAESTGADPQPGLDNLYSQQWDKMRMNVSLTGSYGVQRGRPEVVVAVLDTGVEPDHPDVAANLDIARSRSFVDGEAVFDDFRGHGTFVASTIAAPINTIGISGVAPNVTVVALKVIDKENRFSSLAHVAEALIYTGENHFDVANMAFGTELRRSESEAAIRLLQRAVSFARANGVTLIAAAGNENVDLSDGDLQRDTVRFPVELSGVIGASATGYLDRKPPYSSYGVGKIDVSAPAGDRRAAQADCPATLHAGCPQPVPAPPAGFICGRGQAPASGYCGRGQILGAWSHLSIATGINAPPAADRERQCGIAGVCATPACARASGCFYYRWSTGTSFAAANTSGVAALVISQYGDFAARNVDRPHMSPTAVESILQATANNQPCPDPNAVFYPPPAQFSSATCTGDAGYNSFFGKGIVDALKAVTTYQNR